MIWVKYKTIYTNNVGDVFMIEETFSGARGVRVFISSLSGQRSLPEEEVDKETYEHDKKWHARVCARFLWRKEGTNLPVSRQTSLRCQSCKLSIAMFC
jgi:hypothetical protein